MSYQVIARKWRPQTFADLVGQQHVTETLANAIKNDRVAHAYIFSGARGVGKTTAARILAKALNCLHGPTAEPCGVCDSCREITAGTSLDVIEIDAASNRGIDQIRELREMVRYAPASSRSKVVILDEAHMLTGEASNALLKTLEEPPDRVTFVMATTQPEDLVDTIRSRSQHFHFRALTFSEITARLEEIAQKENLKIDAGALAVIARMAEGSMRDGLSLLEQARAYCGEEIGNDAVRELLGVVPDDALAEMVAAIAEGSAERALGLIHTFQKEGRNLQHFCREAIRHMRNLLIAKVCGAESDLIAATADQRPALAEGAAQFSEEDLTRFFQILLQTDDDLRRKPDPRVHLEMGLLRLINAARLAPLEELLTEIKTGTGGAPPIAAPKQRAATASSGSTSAGANFSASAATPMAQSDSSTGASPQASMSPARTASAPMFSYASPARETNAAQASPSTANRFPDGESRDRTDSRVAASEATNLSFMGSPTNSSAVIARPVAAGAIVPAVMRSAASAALTSLPGFTPAATPPNGKEVASRRDRNVVSDIQNSEKPLDEKPAVAKVAAESPARADAASETKEDDPEVRGSGFGNLRLEGISEQQVSEIKAAVQKQQKFLGELLEHASAWELSGTELKFYFPVEKKPFAEMIEGRDSLEKLRATSSNVLGRPIRVCAKLEVGTSPVATRRADSDMQELRARFDRDPLVRSLLQRFGGKIGEVRRA